MEPQDAETEAEQILRIYKDAMGYYEHFCNCFKQLGKGKRTYWRMFLGYAKIIAKVKTMSEQAKLQNAFASQLATLKSQVQEQGEELNKLRQSLSAKNRRIETLEAEKMQGHAKIKELQDIVQVLGRRAGPNCNTKVRDKQDEKSNDKAKANAIANGLPPTVASAKCEDRKKNYAEEYFRAKFEGTLESKKDIVKRPHPVSPFQHNATSFAPKVPETPSDSLSTLIQLMEHETKDLQKATANTLTLIKDMSGKSPSDTLPHSHTAPTRPEGLRETSEGDMKKAGLEEGNTKDNDYVLELFTQSVDSGKEQDFFGLALDKGSSRTTKEPPNQDKLLQRSDLERQRVLAISHSRGLKLEVALMAVLKLPAAVPPNRPKRPILHR